MENPDPVSGERDGCPIILQLGSLGREWGAAGRTEAAQSLDLWRLFLYQRLMSGQNSLRT